MISPVGRLYRILEVETETVSFDFKENVKGKEGLFHCKAGSHRRQFIVNLACPLEIFRCLNDISVMKESQFRKKITIRTHSHHATTD